MIDLGCDKKPTCLYIIDTDLDINKRICMHCLSKYCAFKCNLNFSGTQNAT